MPAISVIVPVYNSEKYLHCCVGSILNQTFSDFELILVDDGSPDNCGMICDKYANQDTRVRVIHKENAGVSCARNTALEIATGEFITFCDSDDYIGPERLENMYNAITQNQADIVSTNWIEVINANHKKATKHNDNTVLDFKNEQEKFYFLVRDALRGKIPFSCWALMLKKSIIKNYDLRFCETCEDFAEDLEFFLKYFLFCNRILLLNINDYYYIRHENSLTTNCTTTPRLNSLNEVSKSFSKNFFDVFKDKKIISDFCIVHSLLMENQYGVLRVYGKILEIEHELNKIIDKDWYIKYTRETKSKLFRLAKLLGIKDAYKILLFTFYCLSPKNAFLKFLITVTEKIWKKRIQNKDIIYAFN